MKKNRIISKSWGGGDFRSLGDFGSLISPRNIEKIQKTLSADGADLADF
jgi:hypothetical protein